MPIYPYLSQYPADVVEQVRQMIESGKMQTVLARRYPERSKITNDQQLRKYVLELKSKYLKRSKPLSKIQFDEKIELSHGALGLHSFVLRAQGAKTKAKNELRVASLFKKLPQEFLTMVVVHELSHLKEKDHNKAFYQLCTHMEPDYHHYEFDLRLYLTVQGSTPA